MNSNHQKSYEIVLLIIILLTYYTSSFKIIDCGNSKTKKVDVTRNNKNVVEFSNSIKLDVTERIELWCETDCWFSECTLTHQPSNQVGCDDSNPQFKGETQPESLADFTMNRKHICKFVIEKIFSCHGKVYVLGYLSQH